jgi:hypothetical protein
MRRPGRPETCPLDEAEDVCLECPNRIPPCPGIADRSACPSIRAGAERRAPPVPLAAYHECRDLARACTYRWDDDLDSGCGCHEPRVCLAGKGRENFHLGRLAIVTLQDCMACVAAD